jgi:hypothetical protein
MKQRRRTRLSRALKLARQSRPWEAQLVPLTANDRDERLSRIETDRLLIETTAKLKAMVELCDRQRTELQHLRAVYTTTKAMILTLDALFARQGPNGEKS